MLYDNGDERIYPNDDDHDYNGYDEDCEDEPGETFCAPKAILGYTKIGKVGEEYGDTVFGKARNDVGDELEIGYETVHGRTVTGGVTIPVMSNIVGQHVYSLVTIDGGADKVSSLYRAELSLKLNRSVDLLMESKYVDTREAHGVLSPSQPRITSWCTAVLAEQIALDAMELQTGVSLNDVAFTGKAALEDYNHPRPGGTSLDDVTAWQYGWPVEARVEDVEGTTTVHKRKAMGRGNWDGMHCLPDGKTCLFWGEGMLFAFVAEAKFGLDYGRLFYASKVSDGAISWMEMTREASEEAYPKVQNPEDEDEADDPAGIPDGQGDSLLHEDEIAEFWAEQDDQMYGRVFEMVAVPASGACPADFRKINDAMAGASADEVCLKLVAPGAVAARLETVRYAKFLGAEAGHFAGLADVTFSREFKETEDDDRGALFFAFSTVTGAALPSGEDACGAVLRATLTSWKDVENTADDDEDPEYELEKPTSWLPKTLSVVAAGGNDLASCAKGIRHPASLAWSHFHNMLFVGTDGSDGVVSAVIGIETDAAWLEGSGTEKFQTVYEGPVGSKVQGLTWNQNMIGNGDAYLTFGLSRRVADDMDGEFGLIGPLRMRGYMAGSTDQLQNLGCPQFDKEHYLYRDFVAQEWPIPDEDEDED